MIKKIVFIYLIIKIIFFIGVYFYFNNFNQKDITTLFVVTDESLPNKPLHIFLIKNFSKDKLVKVLFINDEITVVKKKVKSIPIKEGVYLQNEKNRISFVKKEVEELLENSVNINSYIFTDVSTINSFIKLSHNDNYDKLQEYVTNDNDYGSTIIANIRFIKCLVDDIDRYNYIKILKFIYNNRSSIHTDISFKHIIKLYHVLVNIKNVYFSDIATINKRNRIEVDKELLKQTITFFKNESKETSYVDKIKVEVLNSSNKSRLAIKVVDLLRDNNFDIFDWGSYNKVLDNTIIIDYINDYAVCKKIQKLIKCGDIIYKPNNNPFADISVILAKDCEIVDKLDKIK